MAQEQETRNRESRPPREGHGGPPREGRPREDGRRDDRRGDRGRPEGPPEIDIDKLISDSLYLDNQAHGIVSRMRDMDSATKSQLRRLYNAVRRAYRAPENERQRDSVIHRFGELYRSQKGDYGLLLAFKNPWSRIQFAHACVQVAYGRSLGRTPKSWAVRA